MRKLLILLILSITSMILFGQRWPINDKNAQHAIAGKGIA